MNVMIVGADQELQQKLARCIPISRGDRVIEASGMLSALWYAETHHPDLIVLDLLPPDCCGLRLAELLKRTCPRARLLAIYPEDLSQPAAAQRYGEHPPPAVQDLSRASLAFAS